MAQEIKNAFKEIVDRLEAANEGGILVEVKLVEGPTEETFVHADLPVVIYEILSAGFVEDACFPRGARAKFTVLFTIMTDVSEGYYSDEGLGIVDLYEKIMTVIDGSDLTGAGHWGSVTPQCRAGGFERDGLINTFLIEAEFQTPKYTRGTLRT
jgi:hypothetical protein